MCRCPIQKKYMMVWSPCTELGNVEDAVENHARLLKEKQGVDVSTENTEVNENSQNELPSFAPGSVEDYKRHSSYYIDLDKESPISKPPRKGLKLSELMNTSRSNKRNDIIDEDHERKDKRARTHEGSNDLPEIELLQ